jgi:putative endonuclease
MYFVYILQSERTGRFYIGMTDHLLRRFNQHRRGYNKSTRGRGPWQMPYYAQARMVIVTSP